MREAWEILDAITYGLRGVMGIDYVQRKHGPRLQDPLGKLIVTTKDAEGVEREWVVEARPLVRIWRGAKCTIAGLLIALLLPTAAPARGWERFEAGKLVIYVSDSPVAVDAECKLIFDRAGAAYIGSFRGCADLQNNIIISNDDPAVIVHEFCHWILMTQSHETCKPPGERPDGWWRKEP